MNLRPIPVLEEGEVLAAEVEAAEVEAEPQGEAVPDRLDYPMAEMEATEAMGEMAAREAKAEGMLLPKIHLARLEPIALEAWVALPLAAREVPAPREVLVALVL
jgi:hypothetical protein